jgi:hypothetical protein
MTRPAQKRIVENRNLGRPKGVADTVQFPPSLQQRCIRTQ